MMEKEAKSDDYKLKPLLDMGLETHISSFSSAHNRPLLVIDLYQSTAYRYCTVNGIRGTEKIVGIRRNSYSMKA